jgi:uncharacterized RDD family membrane protein YckC
VVTPEAVVLDFQTAGIGSRCLALLVDWLALAVALILMLMMLGVIGMFSGTAAVIGLLIGLFVLVFGYPALCEWLWDGQTLGKRALGLRVITVEGGPVGLRHSAIRAMAALIDFWLPPGGLVALTLALLTGRSQRLGDLAAGTVVIRRPRSPQAPVFFAPVGWAASLAPRIDGGGLRAHQYALVREFLLRAPELLPEARAALAGDLAQRASTAVVTPVPPGVDPEQFLVAVLVAHQRRFAHRGPVPGMTWTAPPAPLAPTYPGPVPAGAGPAVALSSLPPPPGPPVTPGR